EKVENAVRCLAQHDVEFNTLTVVNRTNMHHPVQVYRYLKSIGKEVMEYHNFQLVNYYKAEAVDYQKVLDDTMAVADILTSMVVD
ncbi:hypothetical protein MJL48_33455, partial [Salmonella enterica subsp. enterica serovar Kentucky]|nr:hypothetical protein [Salmonella enterica subsp. enterica serovar Kentucky]